MNDADIERLMVDAPRTIEVTGCPCALCANIRARRTGAKVAGWVYANGYGRPAKPRWDQIDPAEMVEFTAPAPPTARPIPSRALRFSR